MSAKFDDGGPAFPAEAVINIAYGALDSAEGTRFTIEGGMSLRDFFAASAIVGRFMFGDTGDVIAGDAYTLADAMIEARNKNLEEKQ